MRLSGHGRTARKDFSRVYTNQGSAFRFDNVIRISKSSLRVPYWISVWRLLGHAYATGDFSERLPRFQGIVGGGICIGGWPRASCRDIYDLARGCTHYSMACVGAGKVVVQPAKAW